MKVDENMEDRVHGYREGHMWIRQWRNDGRDVNIERRANESGTEAE